MNSVPRSGVAVKPAPAVYVDLRVPPIPFNRFETWPGVRVLVESANASVLRVSLAHPEAAVTLGALYALGAQRVEPV